MKDGQILLTLSPSGISLCSERGEKDWNTKGLAMNLQNMNLHIFYLSAKNAPNVV